MIIKANLAAALLVMCSAQAFAYSCGGDGVTKKQKCECIEQVREEIRSQQRVRSTQYLRDQYTFWTDVRNSECKS